MKKNFFPVKILSVGKVDYQNIKNELLNVINMVENYSAFCSVKVINTLNNPKVLKIEKLGEILFELQKNHPKVEIKLIQNDEFEIAIFDSKDLEYFYIQYGVVEYYRLQFKLDFMIPDLTDYELGRFSSSARRYIQDLALGINFKYFEIKEYEELIRKGEIKESHFTNSLLNNKEFIDEGYNVFYLQNKIHNSVEGLSLFSAVGLNKISCFRESFSYWKDNILCRLI
jgi:hypothetical protein